MCYWYKLMENVVEDFEDEGYNFNQIIAETYFIAIAIKLNMSYDFYINHNLCAVEWNLNAITNKSNKLINKLDRSKRHLLIRKRSHVPLNI